MNIMLFSRICAKSGVGNHMRQLAECLVDKGNKVLVVSGTNEQKIQSKRNLNFITLPVATKNPIQMISNILSIRKLIKNGHIDIVHCHHRVASLYMKVYRIFWKTPVVYTLHLAPIPSDFIHRKLTYVGDRAIAVSSEIKDFMNDNLYIPENKIDVVLNGVYPPEIVGGGMTGRAY